MSGADDRILSAAGSPGRMAIRVLLAALLGCAAAGVLGASALTTWSRSLPIGEAAAVAWEDAMSTVGLGRPRDWVRDVVRAWERPRF